MVGTKTERETEFPTESVNVTVTVYAVVVPIPVLYICFVPLFETDPEELTVTTVAEYVIAFPCDDREQFALNVTRRSVPVLEDVHDPPTYEPLL